MDQITILRGYYVTLRPHYIPIAILITLLLVLTASGPQAYFIIIKTPGELIFSALWLGLWLRRTTIQRYTLYADIYTACVSIAELC